MSLFEVTLVRIFPAFSRIQAEYGEIRNISLYSVRMRENAAKMRTRITPNTDSFYAVHVSAQNAFKDNQTILEPKRTQRALGHLCTCAFREH